MRTVQQGNEISLMPEHGQLVSSPGYRTEKILVRWDIDREMYSPPGKVRIGEKWEYVFVPNRHALDKLQVAAGISTDKERTWTRKVEEYLWIGGWGGTYTTPAGIPIDLYDEYEFDVRPEVGTRWKERMFSEYASLVANKVNASYLDAEGVVRQEQNIPEEELQMFKQIAEAKATRWCIQQAQYGKQRALTGARLRALRTYFNISKYTREQVENSYFFIQRTHLDREMLAEQVGDKGAKLLMFSDLLRKTGVQDTTQIVELAKVLIEDGQTIEGEVIEDEFVEPFDEKAQRQTIGRMKRAVLKIWPERAPLSDRALGESLSKLFGRDNLADTGNLSSAMSEGEALLALEMYSRLGKDIDDGDDVSTLKKKRKEYVDLVRVHAGQRTLWEDGDELVQGKFPLVLENEEEQPQED